MSLYDFQKNQIETRVLYSNQRRKLFQYFDFIQYITVVSHNKMSKKLNHVVLELEKLMSFKIIELTLVWSKT